MFDKPSAGGDLFVNAEHVGDLLVVQVKAIDSDVSTENGTVDVPRCDVTVINPDGTVGDIYRDTWLFGKVLLSQLRASVGRTVLGVFHGEPGVKKAGKNLPYKLNEADDEQTEMAVRAMTGKPGDAAEQEAAPAKRAPARKATPAPAAEPAPAEPDDDVPPWARG